MSPGRCYDWTGAVSHGGYGAFRVNGRIVRASRFAYGDVPDGLEIDHLCRRPVCVRRSHLEAVTHLVNMRRGNGNGRKTHCPQGHPYSGDNLYIWPNGRRGCRTCHNEQQQRYSAARKGRIHKGVTQ